MDNDYDDFDQFNYIEELQKNLDKMLEQEEQKQFSQNENIQHQDYQMFIKLTEIQDQNQFNIQLQNLINNKTSNIFNFKKQEYDERQQYSQIRQDNIFQNFHQNWFKILDDEILRQLKQCYEKAYCEQQQKESKINILPKKEDVFNVFLQDPEKIKCIILGQDPYPGRGDDGIFHACGYSFSTRSKNIPKSLQLILQMVKQCQNKKIIEFQNLQELKQKEKDTAKKNKLQNQIQLMENYFENQQNQFQIENYDYQIYNKNKGGILQTWIDQGVFLINTILTVQQNEPNSHEYIGWQEPIQKILNILNKKLNNYTVIVFGSKAKSFLINLTKGKQFQSVHPSFVCRSEKNQQAQIEFADQRIFLDVWLYMIQKEQIPIHF